MKKIRFLLFIAITTLCSLNSTAQTALNFDGINDYVIADSVPALSLSNSFTYEAWVYPTAPHEIDAESLTGFGGTSGQNFLIWPVNGTIPYATSSHAVSGISVGTNGVSVYEHTSGYMPCLLSFPFQIVGWTHIAVVCNNKSYSLYLNGYPVKVGLTSSKPDVHPTLAGGIGGGQYGYFKGSADNLRLWDYARSQEEIVDDMKRCLSGSEPGLVTFFDFEEGTPSGIITDLTAGMTATLTNMDPNTDWVFGISCFNLDDRDVFAIDTVVCAGDSTIVIVDSSQSGVYYFLRDDSTYVEVSGPVEGNGDSTSLNTGSLLTTGTYNTYAIADYAIDLPSSDDHVRFSTPFTTFTNEITIEAWINYNNAQHPYAGQSADGSDNMSTNVWLWDDGTFYVNDGGTWRSLAFPGLPTGWTHVATVANSSGLYIYYNGALVDSSTTGITTGITINPTSIIDLGHDPRYSAGTAGRNTNTAFDDFRVWKVARSGTAIAAQMDLCAFFGDSNLVQHTTFEEGMGNNITSFIGSNAQIMNASTNWMLGSASCPSYAMELSQQVSITVNPVDSTTEVITACDAYTWINGITYTTSNNLAKDTLVNAFGCDSIIHLDLTILFSDSTTVDTAILQGNSITVGSSTYNGEGIYTDTLTNANGCDSIVITNLSILIDGISNLMDNNIRVFPNPAQHYMIITGVTENIRHDIRILNILGQDITEKVTFETSDAQIKVNLSNIASGVYLVKTATSIHRITVEK